MFHQKRNGMSTISQPVAKNKIFWVRDTPRLDFGSGMAELFEAACGADVCGKLGMEFGL